MVLPLRKAKANAIAVLSSVFCSTEIHVPMPMNMCTGLRECTVSIIGMLHTIHYTELQSIPDENMHESTDEGCFLT